MPLSDGNSSFLSHLPVQNTDLETEKGASSNGAKQQAKLEEGLDPNLVISGMTQGSEEFLTSQNEICLPAIKGTFKAGLTHSIPCQGGEDFI